LDKRKKYGYCFAAGLILLAIVSIADITAGGSGIGLREIIRLVLDGNDGSIPGNIIWKLRIPRLITAIIAGAAMAVSGTQMQSIFRNPLADPHIMGVSAGAGLGAAAGLLAAGGMASGFSLTLAAFAGAALTSILIIAVSSKIKGADTLLIFGVMLGFIFSAVTSVLEYSSDEENLKIFYTWYAGSFTGSNAKDLIIMATALAAGTMAALLNHKGLDIILFGDEYATLAGGNVKLIRMVSMASSCILTGAVTAFCGPIGFVGIISPHISGRILGTRTHMAVIPFSIITGGIISVSADILSVIAGISLPAGSTIALIGIPVILYILFRGKDKTFQQ
jgi:iron complex transport system permease protein